MNTEYIRDEKIAPYVIIVAKDGSKFFVVDQDCKVSYNDAIYDRITETNAATAISKIELRTEKLGTRKKEGKSEALLTINKIAAEISLKP